MAEIKKVILHVAGEELIPDRDTGAIEKQMSGPGKVKLMAELEPSDAGAVKWEWKENGSVIEGAGNEREVEYAGQGDITYTVTATSAGNASVKESNRVVLKGKGASSGGQLQASTSDVVEVETGEYDPKFAGWVGFVLAVFAAGGLVLLAIPITLAFPAHDSPAPNAVSYLERLRGFAVIAATFAGIALLALGGWLAALEVRGRLRRTPVVTGRAVTLRDLSNIEKVLTAAGKLRGTIAVLVSAVTLLLAALWTTGRTQGAEVTPEPTTTPTEETTPSPPTSP